MSIEADQLRRQVGAANNELLLSVHAEGEFKRNEAYGVFMTRSLRGFFVRIADDREPRYYEEWSGGAERRNKFRAIAAPYSFFHDIDNPDDWQNLVRILITEEETTPEDRILHCNDFTVDTRRNAMSWRRQHVGLQPPTDRHPNGYWPASQHDVPKVLSERKDSEDLVTVTIHTGTSYEKSNPSINNFLKVTAARTFSQYAAHLSLGNRVEMARDVIFASHSKPC